jgi:hypothetical protein
MQFSALVQTQTHSGGLFAKREAPSSYCSPKKTQPRLSVDFDTSTARRGRSPIFHLRTKGELTANLLSTLAVLDSLIRRPSRASAAAIGHHFILNGAHPALGILGIDALASMTCDWAVAILEETISDASRGYRLRQYTLTKLGELLTDAIEHGYPAVTKRECCRLVEEARAQLEAHKYEAQSCEIQAVEHLSSHLSQAVEDGLFGQLPDF